MIPVSVVGDDLVRTMRRLEADPMPEGSDAPTSVRAELIRLFMEDAWRLTVRAETDGKAILLERGYKPATQWGICEYIVEKIDAGTRLAVTSLGQPKRSRGLAYEMRNVDGKGLYIKLKIEEGEVWVLSFHY